ncbi:conserved hypothetical protein [Pseudoalteromonas sp. 3J6]|nr:conserved hypothetical protein [Pseudoalteromonas sp. 3J6]
MFAFAKSLIDVLVDASIFKKRADLFKSYSVTKSPTDKSLQSNFLLITCLSIRRSFIVLSSVSLLLDATAMQAWVPGNESAATKVAAITGAVNVAAPNNTVEYRVALKEIIVFASLFICNLSIA